MNQIVIVGAGPTGLTLAMLLARHGINVKLIEASRSFRRTFRGEGLMPSGIEAIEQMGLANLIEHIPHRALDAWEFFVENRLLFRVDEPMEINGKSCTLISQPAFLEAVVNEATRYSNFEFIPGVLVQDLLWQDDRVMGIKLSDDRTLNADLVIGADGRNSTIRQKANLSLQKEQQSFDILWFKLPTRSDFKFENVFYAFLSGREAFGLFQGSEGHLQLGWSLHKDNPIEWQQINWAEKLASASPKWLAEYFQQHSELIERPTLLSVVVGRCSRWNIPGLLLLGDAAHPMSPIRAQGINMALRDVIVATNHLIPLLKQSHPILKEIDATLSTIQAERETEIIKIQQLQREEADQGELLRNQPLIRFGVSRLASLIRNQLRQSWLKRQIQLRQGFTQVSLKT
jgi:2-polyprenyl-6-methoxyphenol hydroxylase-like FAD-dependent oxidoreductase